MRSKAPLAAIICAFVQAELLHADPSPADLRTVHAVLAKTKEDKPATSFSADVPDVWLLWKGAGLVAGDKIRAVWIAEDVGSAAPKESKIGENSFTASKPDETGAVSLSRPRSQVWPVGKYRTEIYIDKRLVRVLKFTITPGVSIELN